MNKKNFGALCAAALLSIGLAGCATQTTQTTQTSEPQTLTDVAKAAAADAVATAAAQKICLLPNTNIKVPQINEVVAQGLKFAGFDVSILEAGSTQAACERCVAYAFGRSESENKYKVLFQSFLNGKEDYRATGDLSEKGEVSATQLAQYAAAFAQQLQARSNPQAAQQSAQQNPAAAFAGQYAQQLINQALSPSK